MVYDEIKLTRRDMSRAEIDSAINLLLAGDYVSAHVLAFAGKAILRGIAKGQGIETLEDEFELYIKDEHVKKWRESIVAKLDRLSRNAAFLMTLRDSGVEFIAADLPEANTMTVGVMAVVAQYEREAISQRTKAALCAAKARGKLLGGKRFGAAKIGDLQRFGVQAAQLKAREMAELRRDNLEALLRAGFTLNAMAKRLNADSVTTARGGKWTATAAKRCLATLSI